MALDLEKLNSEQKQAIIHETGPLLIVAGAGTGKTTVITQRIVNLIKENLAKPEEILAVTFTEKAASEMEERVDRHLDFGYIDLWISTFHAFCERVLRDNALDIGLSPDFKILDASSGWLLVSQNLDKFALNYYKALGNPTKFIQALISHFSHCKDQEIYPEDYLNYAETLKTRDDSPEENEAERIKEVANIYHAYQQILLKNNFLDFGDLINYCLKLFKKRPAVLEKYRKKFKYILVDEFQDTNWSQYELIKLLSAPANNLTVCADDDQAIYRWRGASFSNIVQFSKDFPNAKKISLLNNYRSGQNILDLSYGFIKQNNPDRLEFQTKINKKLLATTREKGIIEHIHCKNIDEEVGQILKKILGVLKGDKDASYNDFCILVRANNTASPFVRALERAGIPYQFLASKGLYSKSVILDVISYFKLLDNYHEGSACYRILNLPFLEISDHDIALITQYSRKKARSLFEAMNESPLITGLSKKAQGKIVFILDLIKKHSAMAREKSVSEILVSFLGDSEYLKFMIKNNEQEKIALLNQFYKRVKSFEETTLDPSLKNFTEQINMELEAGEEGKLEFDPEQGPDMVKVMTIHGAKGLEFKYVFLVSMVDKRFPTIERKDPIELPKALIKDIIPAGDVHLQEERRLCYVAMTRARKGLYFTSADDYGGQRKKKISRFLSEMSALGGSASGEGLKLQTPTSKDSIGLTAEKIQRPVIEKKVQPQYLPQHFSYSQLAAFEKCPLQYRFAFILRVPVRGKAIFSFGKTMHKTLHDFLLPANSASQKNLFGVGEENKKLQSFNELEKIFEKSWIDEWYRDKKQKDEYYKLGKKIIKEFYEGFSKNPPEILSINGSPALEMPFNLKIGGHTLFGVIDRIDSTDDGVKIIDYKTGQPKEKLNFDAKEQLLIYQIATQEVLHLKPKQLTYYYLEGGKKATFLGSDIDISRQKEKIIDIIEKIKSSEFIATPGWQCQFCDFREICDFAKN